MEEPTVPTSLSIGRLLECQVTEPDHFWSHRIPTNVTYRSPAALQPVSAPLNLRFLFCAVTVIIPAPESLGGAPSG